MDLGDMGGCVRDRRGRISSLLDVPVGPGNRLGSVVIGQLALGIPQPASPPGSGVAEVVGGRVLPSSLARP